MDRHDPAALYFAAFCHALPIPFRLGHNETADFPAPAQKHNRENPEPSGYRIVYIKEAFLVAE